MLRSALADSSPGIRLRLFVAPFTDLFAGLTRSTDVLGARAPPLLLVACAAGWWLHVPLHELMHAWGQGDDVVAVVGRRFGGAFSWIDGAGVAALLLRSSPMQPDARWRR